MLKSTIKIYIPDILMLLFSLIYFITHIIKIPALYANFTVASIGILCFVYVIIKKGLDSFNNTMILYGIIFSFLMILSILFNRNADWDNVLWVWSYLGVALLFFRFTISIKMLYTIFYFISLYFFVNALKGVSPQSVLTDASGNNISVILIFFMILIYLQIDRQSKKIIYLPALVTVVLSFWGNGRAGLVSSSIFLVSLFLYQYIFIKKGNILTLLKFSIFIVMIVFIIYNYFGTAINDFLYKYDRYGMTSIRTSIWQEYIEGCLSNVGNFLFGVPTKDSIYHYMSYYNGNTHNSFLMLHAKFGLFTFLYVIYIFIQTSFRSFREKDLILLISIVTMVIRSMFDWIAFPGIFDVIFWYLVMNMNMNVNVKGFKC